MYVRACADDGCASVGIEIHSFLVARVITVWFQVLYIMVFLGKQPFSLIASYRRPELC